MSIKLIVPLGGKYDLLSALCGQSTTKCPNLRKLAVISSVFITAKYKEIIIILYITIVAKKILPSSISGGRPPTKTLRENRSLGSLSKQTMVIKSMKTKNDLDLLDIGKSLNNDSVSFPVKNGDFPN